MSTLSFVRRHRPSLFRPFLREFYGPRRPDLDFSDIRRRAQVRTIVHRLSLKQQIDPVQRLDFELRRFRAEEFRLEQVTALRQIDHLRPLVERRLPRLAGRRAARAAALLEAARALPDPEILRRQPILWWRSNHSSKAEPEPAESRTQPRSSHSG